MEQRQPILKGAKTETDKPLVSAITIFLDTENFFEEAIQSVFAQTYDKWELLLVDDGSTDRSTAIALRYAEKYPGKVRYLEHEGHQNRGMSASRNLGMRHAKGRYIAFLDADDIWLPHKLEQQVAVLNGQPEAAMLYGRTLYWFSWSGNPEDTKLDWLTDRPPVPLDTLVKPIALLTAFLKNEDIYPAMCSVIVRREVFNELGAFEDEFRDTYEDMVFHTKVFLNKSVFFSGQCWDRYRMHSNNCWKKAVSSGQYHPTRPNPARRAYLTWAEKYMSEHRFVDTEPWRLVQKELFAYRHPHLSRLWEIRHRMTSKPWTLLRPVAKALPEPIRCYLRRLLKGQSMLAVGQVRFGDLRRLTPFSRDFGFDRGRPVDRYFIENFLERHSDDVKGRTLEIADPCYTRRFGGERVTQSEVLDVNPDNHEASIIADLTHAPQIAVNSFDCIILTQTLQCIYDFQAAIRTLHRILKPGGVLLATFPGITQSDDYGRYGDTLYWCFTERAARRVFAEVFGDAGVTVTAYGNILVATAFLYGLASQELMQAELDHRDPNYEFLITIRAQKQA